MFEGNFKGALRGTVPDTVECVVSSFEYGIRGWKAKKEVVDD